MYITSSYLKTQEHIWYVQQLYKEGNISPDFYDKVMFLLENIHFIKDAENLKVKYQIPTTSKELESFYNVYENENQSKEYYEYYVFLNYDAFKSDLKLIYKEYEIDWKLQQLVHYFILFNAPFHRYDNDIGNYNKETDEWYLGAPIKKMEDRKYKIHPKGERLFIEIFADTKKSNMPNWKNEIEPLLKKLPQIKYTKVALTDKEKKMVIEYKNKGISHNTIAKRINETRNVNQHIDIGYMDTIIKRLKNKGEI